jgi:uncharacterized membrane protein YgaE (UPF0421/DUF939 family)
MRDRVSTVDLASVQTAVRLALVSLLSYVCGFEVTRLFHDPSAGVGGLWSLIAGSLALQTTRHATLSSAWLRILGTIVGAVIAAMYLSVLSFSPIGMAACMLVTVLLCHTVRIPDHARLAALTVAVMMVLAGSHPTLTPILSGALRLTEACIGAGMAVIIAFAWPEPKPVGAGPPRAP